MTSGVLLNSFLVLQIFPEGTLYFLVWVQLTGDVPGFVVTTKAPPKPLFSILYGIFYETLWWSVDVSMFFPGTGH